MTAIAMCKLNQLFPEFAHCQRHYLSGYVLRTPADMSRRSDLAVSRQAPKLGSRLRELMQETWQPSCNDRLDHYSKI